ncbi:MAG TPA: hypothetical protein VJN42_02625 [Candidatus Acidoferrum sp.]|nr:hypothetical protein [Candidatus Acidoferrum sp.]
MQRNKSLLGFTLLTALTMCSCYHDFAKGGGGGGGGGGSNKVSVVLTANNPPLTLGLLSFKVVPTSVTLAPGTGSQTTLSINNGNGFAYDLARLQSDSGFLGTATTVPNGTITTITVMIASVQVTFFNGTTFALTNPACAVGAVCVATFAGPFTASVTTSQAISGNTGLSININLGNTMVINGSSLSVTFSSTNTLTVSTLPRQNANLAAGQLDLIEDITGTVTLSGSNVTITPAGVVNRPPITAVTNASTVLDEDPTLTLCVTPTQGTVSSCVSANQAASMDAVLNSDGTFTAQEIEPLLASPVVDTVEGVVTSIASTSQTQFTMIVTDIIPASSSSKIGGLTVGVPLRVNLAAGPAFHVDSKGLGVSASFPASYGQFTNGTNTTALKVGQEVAVHVPSFTAASGTTPASANSVDSVTLRWSRFFAPISTTGSAQFNVASLPSYFGFTPASALGVEIFTGTQGTKGVTNLDGVASGSPPAATPPVGIRGLYIEDPANTLIPAFFAAKVRQH